MVFRSLVTNREHVVYIIDFVGHSSFEKNDTATYQLFQTFFHKNIVPKRVLKFCYLQNFVWWKATQISTDRDEVKIKGKHLSSLQQLEDFS